LRVALIAHRLARKKKKGVAAPARDSLRRKGGDGGSLRFRNCGGWEKEEKMQDLHQASDRIVARERKRSNEFTLTTCEKRRAGRKKKKA